MAAKNKAGRLRGVRGVARVALSAGVLAFLLALLIYPARFAAAVRDSVGFCLMTVVPALFLFMCVSSLCCTLDLAAPLRIPLRGLCALLRLPPAAADALVLGAVSGFPVGSRVAAQLYRDRRMTARQASLLAGVCSSPSPGFLIGVLGQGLWGAPAAGAAVWGICLVSSLLAGLALRGRKNAPVPAPAPVRPRPSFTAALVGSVRSSAVSCAFVCAFILFMSAPVVLLELCGAAGAAGRFAGALLGFFEITAGLRSLAPLTPSGFACACLVSAWGGLSAAAQGLMFLEDASLKCGGYFAARGLAGAFAFTLARLVWRVAELF